MFVLELPWVFKFRTNQREGKTMNFRIDWGYQYLYSRRTYHPTFVWDGELDCENGKIDVRIYKNYTTNGLHCTRR